MDMKYVQPCNALLIEMLNHNLPYIDSDEEGFKSYVCCQMNCLGGACTMQQAFIIL